MQNQTAADGNHSAASAPDAVITKKVGNTVYKIQIHFSKTSKESFSDKLIRIIKNHKPKNPKGEI